MIELRQQIEKSVEEAPVMQAAAAGAATAPAQPATAVLTDLDTVRSELRAATSELTALQGEKPLVKPCVDSQTVAEVISGWTGIPIGKMMKDEINTVLNIKNLLERRVIGQSHALEAIGQRIQTARARLDDPQEGTSRLHQAGEVQGRQLRYFQPALRRHPAILRIDAQHNLTGKLLAHLLQPGRIGLRRARPARGVEERGVAGRRVRHEKGVECQDAGF